MLKGLKKSLLYFNICMIKLNNDVLLNILTNLIYVLVNKYNLITIK